MLIRHGTVLLAAAVMTGCMAVQEAGIILEKNEEIGEKIKKTIQNIGGDNIKARR